MVCIKRIQCRVLFGCKPEFPNGDVCLPPAGWFRCSWGTRTSWGRRAPWTQRRSWSPWSRRRKGSAPSQLNSFRLCKMHFVSFLWVMVSPLIPGCRWPPWATWLCWYTWTARNAWRKRGSWRPWSKGWQGINLFPVHYVIWHTFLAKGSNITGK